MKNIIKKTIKVFPYLIIFVFVFGITFIFANGKMNFNFQSKNNDSINPYYYGVGAKGLQPSEVSLLNKAYVGDTTPFTITVSPEGEVWYFAYPDSYPALSSIKDSSGFELISDFSVTTGNKMPNPSGSDTTYRIYEYNNVTTLSAYKVTYRQS